MTTYEVEFQIAGLRYPITTTYYGGALTPALIKAIESDIHRRFGAETTRGRIRPVHVLHIRPCPELVDGPLPDPAQEATR